MKGIIFTEFTEMVESRFGLTCIDALILECDLPSKGIYTAVGTYPHQELVQLLMALSKYTAIAPLQLLEEFGTHLFYRFSDLYPQLFLNATSTFDFLESVENYIHVEVLKLYPDAELPHFKCERLNEHTMTMLYQSDKSMGHLAIGLIKGALTYFKTEGTITLDPIDQQHAPVLLTIQLNHGIA